MPARLRPRHYLPHPALAVSVPTHFVMGSYDNGAAARRLSRNCMDDAGEFLEPTVKRRQAVEADRQPDIGHFAPRRFRFDFTTAYRASMARLLAVLRISNRQLLPHSGAAAERTRFPIVAMCVRNLIHRW
jgi:hypothetical protein